MKPSITNTISHKGNLNGQSRVMSIADDAESVRLLMRRLTSLYNSPRLATVREVASNALDAHAAAGVTAPIEVSLPTSIDPTYVVEDHGVGMSTDDVLEIFSKYGASTKRTNNNEIGMMGYGAKAPLAWVSEFTVVAVKANVKTVVSVRRGAYDSSGVWYDDLNMVEVVDTSYTNESNGVTVQVPVPSHDINGFVKDAKDFFRYWTPGTVLVDDEQPESIWDDDDNDDSIRVNDDIMLVPSNKFGRFFYAPSAVIVMGNIPYQIDLWGISLRDAPNTQDFVFVINVPIGAVEPTPSREGLVRNERVSDVVQKAVVQARAAVEQRAEKEVREADSLFEAVRKAMTWNPIRKAFLPSKRSWKWGDVTFTKNDLLTNEKVWYYKVSRLPEPTNLNSVYKARKSFDLQQLFRYFSEDNMGSGKDIVLLGFPYKSVSINHRWKIEQYISKHKDTYGDARLTLPNDTYGNVRLAVPNDTYGDAPPTVTIIRDVDTPYFDPFLKDAPNDGTVIRWDDVKEMPTPRKSLGAKASGKEEAEYTVLTGDRYSPHQKMVESALEDATAVVRVPYHMKDQTDSISRAVKALAAHDILMVALPANRDTRFDRVFADQQIDLIKWVEEVYLAQKIAEIGEEKIQKRAMVSSLREQISGGSFYSFSFFSMMLNAAISGSLNPEDFKDEDLKKIFGYVHNDEHTAHHQQDDKIERAEQTLREFTRIITDLDRRKEQEAERLSKRLSSPGDESVEAGELLKSVRSTYPILFDGEPRNRVSSRDLIPHLTQVANALYTAQQMTNSEEEH